MIAREDECDDVCGTFKIEIAKRIALNIYCGVTQSVC